MRIPPRPVLAALAALLLAACAPLAPQDTRPPIVFVHGNGDSASIWHTTLWRFESNGWPRERLFALDAPYPLARTDDATPQDGRTGTAEHMQQVAAEVERARKLTGAAKVVLIGSSRGGNAIRNYLRNGGGGASVSHAIIGGGTSHGVWASDYLPGSEFNGKAPFMVALNAPQGPDGLEVTPGVLCLTLRSDHYDKYAQPDGRWIGQAGKPTNVSYDAPALKGAQNVVLPGRDHREVAFHPEAFTPMWRFLTGQPPARLDIAPEPAPVLNGKVNGFLGNDPTNLPLPGAVVEIHEVSPLTGERLARAHVKTVGADGLWGPFAARPDAYYEFEVRAPGFAITHIYRSPFPRSSGVVHLRPARLSAKEREAGSVVSLSRPRGYFGLGRDRMSLDGKPLPGVTEGVAGLATAKLVLNEPAVRSVVAEFNGERIVVRSWPAKENRVVFAELHY
jgi:pimeloyl-ACP methyl ester carboxylesterase